MKLKKIIFGGLILCQATVYAQSNASLVNEIDKALSSSCLDDRQTSVSVVSLPSGRSLYARQASTSLLPASTMKLVTSAAALNYLGPEYRFETGLFYTGQRVGDTIQGNLVIRGGGDPKLTPEQLWHIAMQVKGRGIRKIIGNLVVDDSFFDKNNHSPSQRNGVTQRAYDAKVGALSVNFNTVATHVSPGLNIGDPLIVWLEPDSDYVYLNNMTKTTRNGKAQVSVNRIIKGNQIEVQVKGSMPLNAPVESFYRSIDDPLRHAGETFRSFLKQAGVHIMGSIQFGISPQKATLLYQHQSIPLLAILKELNTYSNNFIAEQIFKTIATKAVGQSGSHKLASQLVTHFLRKEGVNIQGVSVVDGSGLSRENRFTAQAMTDLLTAISRRFDIGVDFMSALRLMGREGEFSDRFDNSTAQGLVRAKTGSLSGVSTLAGYVANERHQVFAFAIFLNNNRCGYHGADKVEERIVNAIHRFGTQQ